MTCAILWKNGGDDMTVSKAQQRAVAKYVKNNYCELKIRLPKGYRDILTAAAERNGLSVNGYIRRLIEKDNAGVISILSGSTAGENAIVDGNILDNETEESE